MQIRGTCPQEPQKTTPNLIQRHVLFATQNSRVNHVWFCINTFAIPTTTTFHWSTSPPVYCRISLLLPGVIFLRSFKKTGIYFQSSVLLPHGVVLRQIVCRHGQNQSCTRTLCNPRISNTTKKNFIKKYFSL